MCIRNPQAVLGPTLEKMRHSAAMGAGKGFATGSAVIGAAAAQGVSVQALLHVGHHGRDGRRRGVARALAGGSPLSVLLYCTIGRFWLVVVAGCSTMRRRAGAMVTRRPLVTGYVGSLGWEWPSVQSPIAR